MTDPHACNSCNRLRAERDRLMIDLTAAEVDVAKHAEALDEMRRAQGKLLDRVDQLTDALNGMRRAMGKMVETSDRLRAERDAARGIIHDAGKRFVLSSGSGESLVGDIDNLLTSWAQENRSNLEALGELAEIMLRCGGPHSTGIAIGEAKEWAERELSRLAAERDALARRLAMCADQAGEDSCAAEIVRLTDERDAADESLAACRAEAGGLIADLRAKLAALSDLHRRLDEQHLVTCAKLAAAHALLREALDNLYGHATWRGDEWCRSLSALRARIDAHLTGKPTEEKS